MGGGVGSLSFDIQGYGGRPISTHSDRQIKGKGGGCQNWTLFMDVINVSTLTEKDILLDLYWKPKYGMLLTMDSNELQKGEARQKKFGNELKKVENNQWRKKSS